MQISGIGVQPYIYNTSQVSSASLNRIEGIGEDLTAQKTDFSDLAQDTDENMNPLRPGESKNFMDILSSQMAMSQMNATRVMQVPEEFSQNAQMMQPDQTAQEMSGQQIATQMTA